jgi:hypothetical protein
MKFSTREHLKRFVEFYKIQMKDKLYKHVPCPNIHPSTILIQCCDIARGLHISVRLFQLSLEGTKHQQWATATETITNLTITFLQGKPHP